MKYTIELEHEPDGGWGGSIPELPGLFLKGDTLPELLESVPDAVSLYFEGTSTVVTQRDIHFSALQFEVAA